MNLEQKERCCEVTNTECKPWQLSQSKDVCIIDNYNNEHLAIGAADINVFKLLGVHEQGQLVDLAGNGIAISGGTANGSEPINAFFDSEKCTNKLYWKSKQQGSQDILSHAWIGYNFGVPKLDNGRNRYGVNVDIKQHITSISISQSDNPLRRATRIRVERSDDAITWKGVDLVTLINDNQVHQYGLKQSAPSRYWRIRPLEFTGTDLDYWEIKSIQLFDWDETNLFQVEDDYGWIENRDRDYSTTSIKIKGFYDLFEKETALTQVGFTINGGIYYITVNFNDIVNRLGRPVVIGDVLELPSEAQYDPNMNKIKKYLEVTDISWSAEGYTPGWQPTMLRLIAEPMIAKQETQDIIGDMVGTVDQSGLFQIDDSKYSTLYKQTDKIKANAEINVPLRGSDTADIQKLPNEVTDYYNQYGISTNNLQLKENALYVEDAIPPNGLPYTEGPTYPTNPKDKDYHRMTYVGLAENIPARLFKYSASKDRWIYLETDLRSKYNDVKPTMQKLKESTTAISQMETGKKV